MAQHGSTVAQPQPATAEGAIAATAPSHPAPSSSEGPYPAVSNLAAAVPEPAAAEGSITAPASTPDSEEGSVGAEEVIPLGHGHGSPPAPTGGAQVNEDPVTILVALLAYVVSIIVALLAEPERTIGGWSPAPRVLYGLFMAVAVVFMGVSIMGLFGCASFPSLTALFLKLDAIICTDLLVVAITSKFGRWGRLAAAPFAGIITFIMAVIWICGDAHAVENAINYLWDRIKAQLRRRQRRPEAAGSGSSTPARLAVTNDPPAPSAVVRR